MFNGYIAAVVSPFKNNKVDLASFEKYISWISNTGISEIVVCGSTGESLCLSLDEHVALVKTATEVAAGKLKVIGGVVSSSTQKCLSLISSTEKYVDGFLCICPFYIKPTQKQLVSHFTALSQASSKPIILYNNPGRVGISLEESAFMEIVKLDNVVAIKECAADLSRFTLWRKDIKKDFDFLTGNDDSAFGALAMGAVGVISVSANVCPSLCVKAYDSFMKGDMENFKKYRDILAPLHKLMFSEPSPAPAKYALSKMGLISEEIREPLTPISDDLRKKIDNYLMKVKSIDV